MNLLLDTHVLLWAAGNPDRLSETARTLIIDENNTLFFSAADERVALYPGPVQRV